MAIKLCLIFALLIVKIEINGLVPEPYHQNKGHESYSFSVDAKFTDTYPRCNLLQEAYKRIQKHIFNAIYKLDSNLKVVGIIEKITVEIKEGCIDDKTNVMWPSENMDEYYELFINNGLIEMKSNQVWGILRALASLGQLTYRNKAGGLIIDQNIIYDKPRFEYRGFMLDTSRHYLPLKYLIENIELMFLSKMNVFHWHIVDDSSFPYQSTAFPELSAKGSYRNYNYVYTQYDVLHLINEARIRGIRVIPEFDTPGHALSWGNSQPGLLTQCYSGPKPNGFGPINPTRETTYNFLKTFFTEILDVFPDNYVHLGGDEVDFNCWKSNGEVVNFTKKHGFPNDFAKLQGYYMVRLINMVQDISSKTPKKNKQKSMVWQEVFDNKNNVSKENTIIHVWKGDNWQNEMKAVTSSNYKAVMSSCWYLNFINYGIDWHGAYSCDPYNFNGGNKNLILGGEACMWTEFVDETNVIARTWPRASVVAERLWSPQNVTDINDMSRRIKDLRCRLLTNGFQVETMNGWGTFCDRPDISQE